MMMRFCPVSRQKSLGENKSALKLWAKNCWLIGVGVYVQSKSRKRLFFACRDRSSEEAALLYTSRTTFVA